MRKTAAAVVLILAGFGCSEPAAASREPKEALEAPADAPQEGANPLGGAAEPAVAERAFSGVVAQRLPAGGYAYLHISQADGPPTWVATMGRGLPEGTPVRVRGFAARDDFHSPRLNRRFDRIVFGVVESDAG